MDFIDLAKKNKCFCLYTELRSIIYVFSYRDGLGKIRDIQGHCIIPENKYEKKEREKFMAFF